MAVKLSDIKAKNWSFSATAQGEVVQGLDEIGQCILIIVKTQKGTDPLRPDFGSDIFSLLDKPENEAIPLMTKSIVDSINAWETRVDVKKISVRIDIGLIDFIIECVEKTTNQIVTTTVQINAN
jgi:phage baseplate assembly protein W